MPLQKIKKLSDLEISLIEISGIHSDSGAEAYFYKLGNRKYGLKLYKSFSIAYKSYERQRLAAQHGLGPQVGKFVCVKEPTNNNQPCYGYETEKAISVKDNDLIFKRQQSGLQKKLRKIGLGGDFAAPNCGILKNKLVAIDFGTHSQADW